MRDSCWSEVADTNLPISGRRSRRPEVDRNDADPAAPQSMLPAGTIHSQRWPVTLVMRSKSLS